MTSKILNQAKGLKEFNEKYLRFSKQGLSTSVTNLVTYIFLIALSVVFLAPFFYMLGHSLMSAQDLVDPNVNWVPRKFVFINYSYAFEMLNYFPRLFKSLFFTVLAVFGQVMSCSLVGYGLARVKFKGNGIIFGLVIFSMIVPPQCIIVSQYLMYSKINMLESYFPIIFPCFLSLGVSGGLFTFLFRQYYRGVPKELENAALIDGTGLFGAYFKIVFPTAAPTILVTSILSLIWQWNNSFEPSVYVRNPHNKTLPQLLQNISGGDYAFGAGGSDNGIKLAATFLCVLPLIIIFFVMQKRLMKGIESSGLAN